jgi:hypothetical protein
MPLLLKIEDRPAKGPDILTEPRCRLERFISITQDRPLHLIAYLSQ